MGFRMVQAKRAGLGFDDVALVACLDGCSRWDREQASRWPSSLDEIVRDYAERESFESADVQFTRCPEMTDYVRRGGWVVRESATEVLCAAVTQWQPANEAGEPVEWPLVTVGIAHFNLGRFLPATLESLAAQTYPNLEVVVIDDGSRDQESAQVFDAMERRYPNYRFLRQSNTGIGATRNRCLTEARGQFFIPVDADNIARPEMVERFVGGLRRNPGLSAMTCYFLAFPDSDPGPGLTDLFACRPTGGPHTMASIRNVYGDANAIFRTDDFRAIGGYETDRGTSCEDWEAFVKIVHARKRIGVIPDHLFYYRHRASGFSRVTNAFANHQRVLRQFTRQDQLPPREAEVLWAALLGFQQQVEQLTSRQQCLRYRLVDQAHAVYARLPIATRGVGRLVRSAWSGCRRLAVW
jgi:glycosyltransferase involved in cell wall biosynthesis